MIGLIFIGIVLVYLAIVVAAPIIGARFAKNAEMGTTGIWLFGIGGFLLVTVPIFWDWVPTVMTWKQLCNKDAGFFVYKTVEQWKQENPGIAEMLTESRRESEAIEGGTRYFINQRISWEVNSHPLSWGIRQREDLVVDQHTSQVLARLVDYSTSVNGSMVGGSGGGFRDWKLWMSYHTCELGDPEPSQRVILKKFRAELANFEQIGRKK